MRQTVCLNMIVKNEAHVIRRCLASVRPLIDRWLIVDTGSSDGTQDVVREARGQFVASYPLPGTGRFRCFDYDPATGRTSLAAGALLLLIPGLIAIAGTVALFRVGNGERRIQASDRGDPIAPHCCASRSPVLRGALPACRRAALQNHHPRLTPGRTSHPPVTP
jgi:glycosyltransferase involved in cell wall biosynthesis